MTVANDRFDVNGVIPIRMHFLDDAGVYRDPDVVKFGFTDPNGILSEFLFSAGGSGLGVIIRESAGLYLFRLKPLIGSDSEPYRIRWEGVGTHDDARSALIWVREQQVVLTI